MICSPDLGEESRGRGECVWLSQSTRHTNRLSRHHGVFQEMATCCMIHCFYLLMGSHPFNKLSLTENYYFCKTNTPHTQNYSATIKINYSLSNTPSPGVTTLEFTHLVSRISSSSLNVSEPLLTVVLSTRLKYNTNVSPRLFLVWISSARLNLVWVKPLSLCWLRFTSWILTPSPQERTKLVFWCFVTHVSWLSRLLTSMRGSLSTCPKSRQLFSTVA